MSSKLVTASDLVRLLGEVVGHAGAPLEVREAVAVERRRRRRVGPRIRSVFHRDGGVAVVHLVLAGATADLVGTTSAGHDSGRLLIVTSDGRVHINTSVKFWLIFLFWYVCSKQARKLN